MKGLIMEKQAWSYTILTPTGEYKKIYGVAKEEIGQEVTINVKPASKALKAAIMVAMLAIAIILPQVLPSMLGRTQAYAYVSLDINPSVEFAIDEDYIVLNAHPYNNDAKSILSELEYKGEKIGSVLADFTQSAISLRYMSIDNDQPSQVVVSFYSEYSKDEKSADAELVRITEEQRKYLNETGGQAKINTVVVDKETHNEAQRLGISAGMLVESKQKERDGDSSHNKESTLNPVKSIENSENRNKNGEAKAEQKRKNYGKEKPNIKKVSEDKKKAKDQALNKNYSQFKQAKKMNSAWREKENNANPNSNKKKSEVNNNISNSKDKSKKEVGEGKGEGQKNKSNKGKKNGNNRGKNMNNSKRARTTNKER